VKTIKPFEEHAEQYDKWFEDNAQVYEQEVQAVAEMLPYLDAYPRRLEVGIGTGRFASPLGFEMGIDPAVEMLNIAKQRGLTVFRGVGEYLPFTPKSFDIVLMVTTLCFLQDVNKALNEIRRILRLRGKLVIGYIDGDSVLGESYEKRRGKSTFYEGATFYTTNEVKQVLAKAGFLWLEFGGYGGFVVVQATKAYTDEPM